MLHPTGIGIKSGAISPDAPTKDQARTGEVSVGGRAGRPMPAGCHTATCALMPSAMLAPGTAGSGANGATPTSSALRIFKSSDARALDPPFPSSRLAFARLPRDRDRPSPARGSRAARAAGTRWGHRTDVERRDPLARFACTGRGRAAQGARQARAGLGEPVVRAGRGRRGGTRPLAGTTSDRVEYSGPLRRTGPGTSGTVPAVR